VRAAIDLAGLPGLPGSLNGVRAKATRENWPCDVVDDRIVYPLSALPPKTRAHLLASQVPSKTEIVGLPLNTEHAQAWGQVSQAAVARVIKPVQMVWLARELRGTGLTKGQVAEALSESVPPRTLARWLKQIAGRPYFEWPVRLLDGYRLAVVPERLP
jgi:hypothetical protein